MPPTFASTGVRPAAVINEQIRAIVRGARSRRWTQAERTLYGLLLVEWETARRAEIVEAA
ncbi:hypothetical protein [Streptomyces sp. B21-083]|uniref:hypothetical protein n=1 Tax=Streptomyces sp. B21-083 TaxID=3039410 RepID=UPI002FF36C58